MSSLMARLVMLMLFVSVGADYTASQSSLGRALKEEKKVDAKEDKEKAEKEKAEKEKAEKEKAEKEKAENSKEGEKAGPPPQPPKVTPGVTYLSVEVPVGSTELPVVSTEGSFIGGEVVLAQGTPQEEHNKVVGYGSVILGMPTKFVHASGTTVSFQCVNCPPCATTPPPPANPCAGVAGIKYDAKEKVSTQQAMPAGIVKAWAFPLFGLITMFSLASLAVQTFRKRSSRSFGPINQKEFADEDGVSLLDEDLAALPTSPAD